MDNLIIDNIHIPILEENNNLFIEVTEITTNCKKRFIDWKRLTSTNNFISYVFKLTNNKLIYSKKGRYSGGTAISEFLITNYITWVTNYTKFNRDIILSKIVNKLIEIRIKNSNPIILSEELDKICSTVKDVIGLDSLLKQFKVRNGIIKNNYLIEDEKSYFYIQLNENSYIKLSKEDILTIIYYKTGTISFLLLNSLDKLIDNNDYTYLRVRYLLLSQIINTIDIESYSERQRTYLMKDSNTNLIKIGKAVDPKHREKTLQSEKPTISLFAVCENNVESELHKQYKDKRVRGEWFDLTDEEINNIINKFKFTKEKQ